MRIISPFKDYYDGVQRQGYDPLVTYVRKTQSIPLAEKDFSTMLMGKPSEWFFEFIYANYDPYHKGERFHIAETSLLIICGKPYLRTILDSHKNPNKDLYDLVVNFQPRAENEPSYRELNLLTEVYFDGKKLEKKLLSLGWEPPAKKRVYYGSNRTPHSLLALYDRVARGEFDKKCSELAIQHRCPIMEFRYEDRNRALVLNPRLVDSDFQHCMDPFTLYQELAMYVSGVLGSPGNPMVDVSEKVMVDKKGFDPKYGFRKRPKV